MTEQTQAYDRMTQLAEKAVIEQDDSRQFEHPLARKIEVVWSETSPATPIELKLGSNTYTLECEQQAPQSTTSSWELTLNPKNPSDLQAKGKGSLALAKPLLNQLYYMRKSANLEALRQDLVIEGGETLETKVGLGVGEKYGVSSVVLSYFFDNLNPHEFIHFYQLLSASPSLDHPTTEETIASLINRRQDQLGFNYSEYNTGLLKTVAQDGQDYFKQIKERDLPIHEQIITIKELGITIRTIRIGQYQQYNEREHWQTGLETAKALVSIHDIFQTELPSQTSEITCLELADSEPNASLEYLTSTLRSYISPPGNNWQGLSFKSTILLLPIFYLNPASRLVPNQKLVTETIWHESVHQRDPTSGKNSALREGFARTIEKGGNSKELLTSLRTNLNYGQEINFRVLARSLDRSQESLITSLEKALKCDHETARSYWAEFFTWANSSIDESLRD